MNFFPCDLETGKFHCVLSESRKLRKVGGVFQSPRRKIPSLSDFMIILWPKYSEHMRIPVSQLIQLI